MSLRFAKAVVSFYSIAIAAQLTLSVGKSFGSHLEWMLKKMSAAQLFDGKKRMVVLDMRSFGGDDVISA
jgi:hypothetical protein